MTARINKMKVGKNTEQKLFIIPCGDGFSCLGFEVCQRKLKAIAEYYDRPDLIIGKLGTIKQYNALKQAEKFAYENYKNTGQKCLAELNPQLVGLEGKRVEVLTTYGETRRFIVGRSGGWIPCHLERAGTNSIGGMACENHYQSVRRV